MVVAKIVETITLVLNYVVDDNVAINVNANDHLELIDPIANEVHLTHDLVVKTAVNVTNLANLIQESD